MKFWEAMKALEEGKKVRKTSWTENCYLYIDEDGSFYDNREQIPILYTIGTEWETYEEKKDADEKLKQLFQILNEDNWFANNQYGEYIYDNNLVDHMTSLYMQLMEMAKYYKLD